MKFTLAITGSLRDPQHVEQVIRNAIHVKEACPVVQDICLSTTDDAQTVASGLAQWPGIRILRADQPRVIRGHRLHQHLQLRNVLDTLEPDTWVLKQRTDKLIIPPEQLIACIRRVHADPKRYEGKFGILEGHVFLPWFINDMSFLGQVRTLQEIVFLDTSADELAPGLVTEQITWSRLLGARRYAFYEAARGFPLMSQFDAQLSNERGDIDRAFERIQGFLIDYWSVLGERFFPMTAIRFQDAFSLQLRSFELASEYVFSRYGTWGASFTDPDIFHALPMLSVPKIAAFQ